MVGRAPAGGEARFLSAAGSALVRRLVTYQAKIIVMWRRIVNRAPTSPWIRLWLYAAFIPSRVA